MSKTLLYVIVIKVRFWRVETVFKEKEENVVDVAANPTFLIEKHGSLTKSAQNEKFTKKSCGAFYCLCSSLSLLLLLLLQLTLEFRFIIITKHYVYRTLCYFVSYY